MTDYVVDANVLVSMLVSGRSSYQAIAEYYHFYTPSFALIEMEKYRDTIFQKSKLQPEELRSFIYKLFSKIIVLPDLMMTQTCQEKAKELVANVDVKDADYLALAIQLDFVLLTRDKSLIKGVKKKGFRKIMMFDEFLSKV